MFSFRTVLRCRFAVYFGGAGTSFCEDEQGECERLQRYTAGGNNSSKTYLNETRNPMEAVMKQFSLHTDCFNTIQYMT